jgi:hypothetical protein
VSALRSIAFSVILAGSATTILILTGWVTTDLGIAWSSALIAAASFTFHLYRYTKEPPPQQFPRLDASLFRGHWKLAFATAAVALLVVAEVWLSSTAYPPLDSIHHAFATPTLPNGDGMFSRPSRPAVPVKQPNFPPQPASVQPPDIQLRPEQQSAPLTGLEKSKI